MEIESLQMVLQALRDQQRMNAELSRNDLLLIKLVRAPGVSPEALPTLLEQCAQFSALLTLTGQIDELELGVRHL